MYSGLNQFTADTSCCCNLMFYDWSESVMSFLVPQTIPREISVLTLGNKVILYCMHSHTVELLILN